jgi:hypothetical protein
LRFASHPFFRRAATIFMMAAAVAFALQCIFVAASEAATGDTSHYYLGFVFGHPQGGKHSHAVTHRHADGTIHQHAIADDDGALAKHVKTPGWDMALVICMLPSPNVTAFSEIAGHKLTIQRPQRLPDADIGGLRRPPRPPSIA